MALAGACVEPAPPQAFLEVRDSQGIASNAAALAVDAEYLTEVVDAPTSITFPLQISIRAPSRGEAVITTVVFDAGNAPLAFASRTIEFRRRFQDEQSVIVLELVPWAGHCRDVEDCDSASTCVDIVCEPQVLAIGVCVYTPDDSRCAPGSTCDDELGCVTQ